MSRPELTVRRNVNEYIHILRDPRTNEQGLNWLFKLRQNFPHLSRSVSK